MKIIIKTVPSERIPNEEVFGSAKDFIDYVNKVQIEMIENSGPGDDITLDVADNLENAITIFTENFPYSVTVVNEQF